MYKKHVGVLHIKMKAKKEEVAQEKRESSQEGAT